MNGTVCGSTPPLSLLDDARNEPVRRMLASCVHAPPPLQGMFGIVNLNRRGGWERLVNQVGTVAEVRQMSGGGATEDDEGGGRGGGGGGGMSVVAKGRLRFRVVNLETLRERVRDAWHGGSTIVACGSVEVELIGEVGVMVQVKYLG